MTAGRSWPDQNWGAQLVLYGIWRLGGFPLVAAVKALISVAAWGLVAAACRRRTADLRVIAGAVFIGHVASAAIFPARPQMFSPLLFPAELYLPGVARTRPRVALAIPLLWSCGRISMAPSSSGSGCSSSRSPRPPGGGTGRARPATW
jgi:hypothetical protein